MNIVRSERDLMGAIDVPADRLWGAQTQRSLEHFHISTERMPTSLIHVLALTKRAAAKISEGLGLLSEEKTSAVRWATNEVLAGQHDDELPLTIWQTGSGTQGNISMNEVLANRTNELLDGVREVEHKVHPNGDMNKSQSSNDVFPTTMHAMALLALCRQLIPQLKALTQTLSEKSRVLAGIVKVGRIHLQDATPLTLGQEISSWVTMLEHNLRHIEYSLPRVAELTLDGTAVSTGLNIHLKYARRVADELAVITCAPFVAAPNKFEALATCSTLVQTHDVLEGSAAPLMKIANDVRWLASGPRCGVGEISISENEPDSSIIPGKVNPTQCEALIMLCCQVMGDDVAINMGGASDSFELNVFRPMVTHSFLQSMCLLADGMESFSKRCAVDTEPSHERINQLLNESSILITALSTHIGYNKAAEIVKKAHKEGLALKVAALALGYLSEAEFDRRVRLEQMVGSMEAEG